MEGLPVTALLTTNLGDTPLLGRGKVRDLYAVDGALLLVATDRISAFDHVLGTGIPGKGKILTQISLFWFDLLRSLVPNHIITADVSEFPASLAALCGPAGRPLDAGEAGRHVSRGVRGARLPGRLGLEGVPGQRAPSAAFRCRRTLDGSRLPEPVFTPATKSQDGAHDENISFAATEAVLGAADAAELRRPDARHLQARR
jgi:phosphoribosylaminoimidazole-succinocarboxamide synthase